MFLGPAPTPITLDIVGGSFAEGPQGVIGGAHLGYNIQPNPWFVAGIEASVDGTSLRKTVVVPLADIAGGTFGSMTATSKRVSKARSADASASPSTAPTLRHRRRRHNQLQHSYFDTTGFFTGRSGTNATSRTLAQAHIWRRHRICRHR